MKRVKFLLFVLLFSHTPASLAAGSFAEGFLAKGSEVPAALSALGYKQFGALDLNRFLSEISRIRPSLSNNVEALNGNGRLSAHWQNQGGAVSILVNPVWWNKFPDQQSVLALHEYLGTSGFIDDQYWISVSMWFLSQPEAQRLLDGNIKNQIADWISKNANSRLPKGVQLAGGVVGVGGGGEGGSLFAKMHTLRNCLKELAGRQSSIERDNTLGIISHYLSSQLTVTWGTSGRAK